MTALVWDLPYISADLLKDNLTCITFGKPCVSVRVIQTVAQRRPEISTTIRSIYSESDVVPSLMSFLDESWAAKDLSKPDVVGTGGIQLVMTHGLDAVSYIDYPIIYLCCWFTCSLGGYYYLIVIDVLMNTR